MVIIVEDNFNVANPTKENIEHAIKNLLFFVTASESLEEYKNYKEQFNKVSIKIKYVLQTYFNEGNLKSIKEEALIDIKETLMDLDWETKLMNSYYAERALLWIEAIMTLRQSEINLGGVINWK